MWWNFFLIILKSILKPFWRHEKRMPCKEWCERWHHSSQTWHQHCLLYTYVCIFILTNIIKWNGANARATCLTHPSTATIHICVGRIVIRLFLLFSLHFYDYLINLSIFWLFFLWVLKYSNLDAIRQDFPHSYVLITFSLEKIVCTRAWSSLWIRISWPCWYYSYRDINSIKLLQYFSLSFMSRLGDIQFTQLKKCTGKEMKRIYFICAHRHKRARAANTHE